MSYPKWLYHQSLEPKVVQSEAEQSALGSAWAECPFPQNQQEAKIEIKAESISAGKLSVEELIQPSTKKSKKKE